MFYWSFTVPQVVQKKFQEAQTPNLTTKKNKSLGFEMIAGTCHKRFLDPSPTHQDDELHVQATGDPKS